MGSGLNVKSLRLRLGWTQSDLARRLRCQVEEIASWEQGRSLPNSQHTGEMQLLMSHADASAFELQSSPRAENFCARKALGQVHLSGIEDSDKN